VVREKLAGKEHRLQVRSSVRGASNMTGDHWVIRVKQARRERSMDREWELCQPSRPRVKSTYTAERTVRYY
jgi:hypothetical protein